MHVCVVCVTECLYGIEQTGSVLQGHRTVLVPVALCEVDAVAGRLMGRPKSHG